MGKELPLACAEKERWTVLLASIKSGESEAESPGRNKRAQISSASRGRKGAAAKDIETKSKGSLKTKRTNASTAKTSRYGRSNKNRKSDRGDEGEDSKLRRSAQELGITWLDSKCEVNGSHYLKEYDKIDGGSIFRCKHCLKIRWMPTNYDDAYKFGKELEKLGSQEGYCHFLDIPSRRLAKITVAKLQELERLSGTVEDRMELARIADKILSAKDYDRREVEV